MNEPTENQPEEIKNIHDLPKVKYIEDYLESQANPQDCRSVAEIARENGVSASTIHSYVKKHKVELNKEIERRRSRYRTGMRSAAWKALSDRLGKDTKAIALVFQLLGDLVERSEVRTETLSTEDKKLRIKALLSEIAKKKSLELGSTTDNKDAGN